MDDEKLKHIDVLSGDLADSFRVGDDYSRGSRRMSTPNGLGRELGTENGGSDPTLNLRMSFHRDMRFHSMHQLAIAKHVNKKHDVTAIVIMSLIAYGFLYLAFGETFLPYDDSEGWALLLLLMSAHLCAYMCRFVKLPPLIGMLFAGILLRNLPGDPIEGLSKNWSKGIRATGLCIILMRSGLELELESLKKLGSLAARLTTVPASVEALVSGLASVGIFNMPIFLGLSQGFILAAVSPAVVVTGMLRLQERQLGTAKGIPSLVIAAASLDDVYAITGFSLCIGLAVPHGTLAWNIAQGPLNIVFGVLGGLVSGLVCSLTILSDTRWKRIITLILCGLSVMFLAKEFHFPGAGAMASLITAVFAQHKWKRMHRQGRGPADVSHRKGSGGSTTPSDAGSGREEEQSIIKEAEHDLAVIWMLVCQPLLFSVIGTEVDFDKLSASTIPKAIAVTMIGLAVRLPTAFWAVSGGFYNRQER